MGVFVRRQPHFHQQDKHGFPGRQQPWSDTGHHVQLSDSDDGMLLVTICEDGDSEGIPSECAYMNEASTHLYGAYPRSIRTTHYL